MTHTKKAGLNANRAPGRGAPGTGGHVAKLKGIIVKDDRVLFARWLRNPRRIGAVVPSGLALARALAAQVDTSRPGVVVELGGGTGAVTRALLAAGVAPSNLVVVERDGSLYHLLKERFHGVRVLHGDAGKLPRLLAKEGVDEVNCVVSGLPLLAMPPKVQMAILLGAFAVMSRDGAFVQFTYGPTSPVPERRLRRMGLAAEIAGRVWLNVPPASIWRFTAAAITAGDRRSGKRGARSEYLEAIAS